MLRRFLFTALLYPVAIAAVVTVAFVAAPGMAQRPGPAAAGAVYAVDGAASSCPELGAGAASRCPMVAAAAAGCPGARAAISAAAGRCPALIDGLRIPGRRGAAPAPQGVCPSPGSSTRSASPLVASSRLRATAPSVSHDRSPADSPLQPS